MLAKSAWVFGIIFILIGVLGFTVAPDGYLLGIFHVNAAHNWVHILSGIVAIAAAAQGESGSRLYFKVFGVIYAMVALIGFFSGPDPVLGFLANNIADNWLHVAIAGTALYLGFGYSEEHLMTGHQV